jgi:CHAT domain-containing protein
VLTACALTCLGCASTSLATSHREPPTRSLPAAVISTPPSLGLHLPFDRPLQGKIEHRYRISLTGSRYLRLAIEQTGVEVSAVLLSSDGATVATANGPAGWRKVKRLSAVVEKPGDYALLVTPLAAASSSGRYRVELEEIRPPLVTDGDRVSAERRTAEAERLLTQQEPGALGAAAGELGRAFQNWERTGDCAREVQTLNDLAEVYSQLEDSERAQRFSEQALAQAHDVNDVDAEASALLHVGRLAGDASGLTALRDVVEMRAAFGSPELRSEALYRLGMAEGEDKEYHLALALLQLANDIDESGDVAGRGRIQVEIGFLLGKLGRAEAGLNLLEANLQLGYQVNDLEIVGNALYHLAGLQLDLGRLQGSLDRYREAIDIFTRIGHKLDAAVAITELGLTQLHLGERAEARHLFDEALALSDQLPAKRAEREKTYLLLQYAAVEQLEGDVRAALEHAQRALVVSRAAQNRVTQAYALYQLGHIQSLLHEPRQAMASLTEAAEISERSHDGRFLAQIRIKQAEVFRATGNAEGASRQLDEILQVVKGTNLEVRARAAQARVQSDLGRLDLAQASVEKLLEITETQRRDVLSPPSQISFLAARRSSYELSVDVSMRLERAHPGKGYAAEAFLRSELARARGLLDLLREERGEQWREANPDLAKRQDENEGRINDLMRQMIELSVRPSQTDVSAQLETALTQEQRVGQQIAEAIRRFQRRAALTPEQAPLVLTTVQHLLDSRTALLEYFIGSEGCYLFVATRERFASFVLDVTADRLDDIITRLRSGLGADARGRYASYAYNARLLYKLLVRPAEALLQDKSELLIVPDGPLNSLSFEALLTSTPVGSVFRPDLPFLIRKSALAYLPSAAVFAQLGEAARDAPAGKRFIGFGNPLISFSGGSVSPPSEQAGQGRQRSPAQNSPGALEGPILRALRHAGLDRLPPLPFSQREVEGIAGLFRAGEVATYFGSDANEQRVKTDTEVKRGRWIHFATHGVLSDNPDLSGLVLSAGHAYGLLDVRDVARLKLTADLVVLSACRTALGRHVPGEGLIGLPRAFLTAGAASVLVSLWSVDDESTAQFMVAFYKHLEETGDKAAALRLAKLDLMQQGAYSLPYYWAPFILIGLPR